MPTSARRVSQMRRTFLLLCLTGVTRAAPLPAAVNAPDSTASARTLARIVDTLFAHERATSLSVRLSEGLPIERLPDISLDGARRESRFAAKLLRGLRPVKESELGPEERLTRRMLLWQLPLDAEASRYHWLSFASVTPYSTVMNDVVRVFAALSFTDSAGVARYSRLLAQVPPLVDSIRGGLEERARRGIRLPRDEIPLVVSLFRSYRQLADSSPFVPSAERLTSRDQSTRARIRTEGAAAVDARINPSIDRLVAFLEGSYQARAPKRVGLGQYPGGKAYYHYLVRRHTTMDIDPRGIHEIGLRETMRLEGEMAAIRRTLGFEGTAAEFHRQLRADPAYIAATPLDVQRRLNMYLRRIDGVVGLVFASAPHAKGDVRRLDPRLEGAMTFGYYQPPTSTDSVGHYYFNGSKLSERTLVTSAPLLYHELIPGHHYQFATQLENAALSPFRRQVSYTAYTEGWGEYASSLAGEMGMYLDARERYGRLLMDMFLSCRLVVDTGMNEFGWSRDSAMAFMSARVIESPTQLATETLRYSVDLPGQALAYKMGSLEMLRLRQWAKSTLGDYFDIREFHQVLLESGPLPMQVLAGKVQEWVQNKVRAAR